MEEFGYRAICTPRSGDHGVDVVAEKSGRRVAVQVKLYGKTRVGNQAVQMLLGGMRFYDASEALIITTGNLTRKAIELSRKAGVVYYERDSLYQLCMARGFVLPSWCMLKDAKTGCCFSCSSQTVIGRSDTCNVCVPDDMTLSRNHFELRWEGLSLILTDHASSNGTKVNGRRVAEAPLHYGDTIVAGLQGWEVVTG